MADCIYFAALLTTHHMMLPNNWLTCKQILLLHECIDSTCTSQDYTVALYATTLYQKLTCMHHIQGKSVLASILNG